MKDRHFPVKCAISFYLYRAAPPDIRIIASHNYPVNVILLMHLDVIEYDPTQIPVLLQFMHLLLTF